MSFSNFMFRETAIHTKILEDCRWNVDGTYLGTACIDKSCKIAQLEPDGNIRDIHRIPCAATPKQIIWHPTEVGRFAIAGDDKAVEIWDVRAPKFAMKCQSTGSNIYMAWSPDGNYLVVGNENNFLSVFDANTARSIVKPIRYSFEINELAWSANSDHVLMATGGTGGGSGSVGGNLDILEFKNDKLSYVDSICAHTSNCMFLKIDRAFQRMAIGAADSMVSLWDLDDLICYHTIPIEYTNSNSQSGAKCLSFSGNGDYLAIGSFDTTINICDAKSGKVMEEVDTRYEVNVIAWHPRHNLIAIGPKDNSKVLRLLSFNLSS